MAAPPITSEWPLRYLVVECTTMSKPSSSGRWIHGEAKVLSHTEISLCLLRDRGDRRQVDDLQQRIGRASRPRPCACCGVIAFSRFSGTRQIDESRLETRRALAHALEDAVAAAVEVVHRDDVRAGVEQLEHRADRRHAGGEGEAGCGRPPARRGRPRARRASGCACARSRSPCARPGSTARRSRWRRSASSPRRCAGRAPGRRG